MAESAHRAAAIRKNHQWLESLDTCQCCGEVLKPPVQRPQCLDRMGQDPVCRRCHLAYTFLRCPHQWHVLDRTPYQWCHYGSNSNQRLEQCEYCGMLQEHGGN